METKRKIKESLNVKEQASRKGLDADQMKSYKKWVLPITETMRQSVLLKSQMQESEEFTIRIPQHFSLQETFDKWYHQGNKEKMTYLFRDLKSSNGKYHGGKFVLRLRIEFDGVYLS